MVCVYCSEKTSVINSRLQKRNNTIWRRRQCKSCKSIFTTQEIAQYMAVWLVKAKNDTLSPFQRDRLFLSLYRSCQHRPNALTDAAGLVDTAISNLAGKGSHGVLEASTIKQVAQVALNRFDKAASTHYAAFHKN
jgi:transcriptional regulator NrdR family protein